MTPDDVEIIERKSAYSGWFAVDVIRLRHAQYAGGMGPEIRRELFRLGDSTCCLPYDPVRDEVVLIEQFRMAPYTAGDPACWLIETTAGMNDGDSPEDVARKEALEEAGCAITELEHVTDLYPSPGSTLSRASLFVGRTSTEEIGGVHGLDAEDEDIRVFTVPFDEAMRMVDSNEIRVLDAVTILLWLSRHRDRLRRKWR